MTKTKSKPIKKEIVIKKKIPKKTEPSLSHNQIMFCEEYIKTQNAKQSYLKVYSKCKPDSAESSSIRMLGKAKIKAYIDERLKPIREEEKKTEKKAIADANEILELFTKIARGEVKDQFEMDTSVKDRISAGKELAKRYGLFNEPDDGGKGKATPKIHIEVVDNSDLEAEMYK